MQYLLVIIGSSAEQNNRWVLSRAGVLLYLSINVAKIIHLYLSYGNFLNKNELVVLYEPGNGWV